MGVLWRSEACDQAPDAETGAMVVRLTQAALHSINIYCEQPYTSPDGRRIAIMRAADPDPRLPPFELLVADLATLRIASVEKQAASMFVGTAAWSGMIYYVSSGGDLLRLDLATLEKEVAWTRWPFPPEFMLQSVSADLRYLAGIRYRPDYISEVVRIDLRERAWKVIFESAECLSHDG
jgi:hypothetical protein